MRKRMLWILLALTVSIGVTGCGKKEEPASAPAEEEFSTEDEYLARRECTGAN